MLSLNVVYVYILEVSNDDGHLFAIKFPITIYLFNLNFNIK